MELKRLLLLTSLQLSLALQQESCGVVGVSTTPPYFTSTSPTLKHALACGEDCASDGKCQSFGVGLGMCLHFASPLLVTSFYSKRTADNEVDLSIGRAFTEIQLQVHGRYMRRTVL